MISYCGIVCSECPAYLLTQAGDTAGLSRLADRLSATQRPRTAEEMICDGCLEADKRLVPYCRECPARLCGLGRGIDSCIRCESFGCDKLQQVWSIIIPKDARPRLEQMRAALLAERKEPRHA